MHKHLTAMLAAGALIAGGGLAFSHESFTARYDINKPAIVQGIVTTIDWSPPSSILTIEGAGASGTQTEFRIELGSPRKLERSGWRPDTVKEGETVTVIGWYSRDDECRIRARTVKLHGREFDTAATFYEATMSDQQQR